MYENVTFPPHPSDDILIEYKNSENYDALILCHMPYVLKFSEYYSRFTHDYEEMLDSATLGLVRAVHKLRNDRNITSYLCSMIKDACCQAIHNNAAIRTPKRKANFKYSSIEEDIASANPFDELEFEDTIDAIIRLPIERSVVECRRSGLTDTQTAKTLKITRSEVSKIRQRLARRYENESK